MAVTLVVQTDAGTVANANTYITLAEFKAYHDNRGNAYGADDQIISAALVRAKDYLDTRFRYKGVKLVVPQATEWPRTYSDCGTLIPISDADGQDVVGIPAAVKAAQSEYAFKAISDPLYQDAPAPEGGRAVDHTRTKVDVIEDEVNYTPGTAGSVVLPSFPLADSILARAGLLAPSGRRVSR